MRHDGLEIIQNSVTYAKSRQGQIHIDACLLSNKGLACPPCPLTHPGTQLTQLSINTGLDAQVRPCALPCPPYATGHTVDMAVD